MALKLGSILAPKASQRGIYPILYTRSSRNASDVSPVAVDKTGDREWVGYGQNGSKHYLDNYVHPFPAVRFRRPTAEFDTVRKKEKGDWKELTIDEKKKLYRYSYCQTFAEVRAPTGDWKSIIGTGLLLSSLGIWLCIFMKVFVYDDLPESTKPEAKALQLRKALDLQIADVVTGVGSKWDYENDRWK